MKIVGEKQASTLANCLEAAPQFLLNGKAPLEIVEAQILGIREYFKQISEEAALSSVDQRLLWGRVFLNPYVFEGAPADLAALEGIVPK